MAKKGGTLSFLFYDFFMTAKPTENVIDFPLSISVLCHKVYPDVFVVYVYGPQRLCINLYPCTKQLSVLCPRSICSMLNFLKEGTIQVLLYIFLWHKMNISRPVLNSHFMQEHQDTKCFHEDCNECKKFLKGVINPSKNCICLSFSL